MVKWVRKVVFFILFLEGCSAGPRVVRFPVERIPVPERAAVYESEARPDGATGGPGAEGLAAKIAGALARRGQRADADGALASTACFVLHRTHESRVVDTVTLDLASRRFGFGGVTSMSIFFDTQTEAFREELERIPPNVALNRFGLCVSPSGRSAAVVVGALEMQFGTLAKDFEPGQPVTIRGRVGPRFTSANVYLTKADGTVEARSIPGLDVDTSFQLDAAGPYRLEVMGDGPTGPVIVANMPLYVGVAEPPLRENPGAIVDPDVAEGRMLELLNEVRRTAGSPALVADGELREIASGHSEDMKDHNFVGHVSPSTGTPQDRLRRSGLLLAGFGENIALAATPEAAHQGLMESPGHRANMLNPKYTHVGIAAVKTAAGLVITLNFGRRVQPQVVPTLAQLQAAFVELRKGAGQATPPADPVYSAAAQAGADAMAAGASDADITKAEGQAMQRALDRLQTSRSGGCELRIELLELDQLKQDPSLLSPQLRKFGVGARLRHDKKGSRLAAVIMLEGVPCK